MLKNYTTKQRVHIFELLNIYKIAVQTGKFSRNVVADAVKLEPQIAEGRWYAELKRTRRLGDEHDWKTMLNRHVARQLESGTHDTGLIDRAIEMFLSQSVSTKQMIELLDHRAPESTSAVWTTPSTLLTQDEQEPDSAAFCLFD